LRDSEARYRAIVDDQTELVCRYLPDASLTYSNRAFAEFFGSTSDDLAGVKLLDLRPDTGAFRGQDLQTLLEFGYAVEFQVLAHGLQEALAAADPDFSRFFHTEPSYASPRLSLDSL